MSAASVSRTGNPVMNTSTNETEALDRYITEISRFPVMSREKEKAVAERYRETKDLRDAHLLVDSNLKFVVKVAHEYRGYGLGLLDLIQEGNVGLMMAVRKFDPDKGYRLISYGVWWIRAYIQNFVMSSWSLVKIGTTQAQRKLFFKLRTERGRADSAAGFGKTAPVEEIAHRLSVPETEVSAMELRLAARDFSIDAELYHEGHHTYADRLVDEEATQEETYARNEQQSLTRELVRGMMEELNEREQYIVQHRLMADEPETLQHIGRNFGISRERARQIQANVVRKLRVAFGGTGLEAAAA